MGTPADNVLETEGDATPTAPDFNSPPLGMPIPNTDTLADAKTKLSVIKALVDTDTDDDPVVTDGGIIKLATDYINAVETAAGTYEDGGTDSDDTTDADFVEDNVTAAAVTSLKTEITNARMALARAEAVVEALDGLSPTIFPNESADLVVLVKFQDPAVEKVGTKTVSMVEADTVDTDGESTVTIQIMDTNEVGLNGFVTLTIDPDAGADVMFSESQLMTHRVEVKNGKLDSSATIEGLPERGPVRVKVTADFNSGQLILEGYVMRLGNPDSVTAMTYSCILNDDEDSETDETMCAEEMVEKTSKLNETTVFGPGEQFLVVGSVMDAAGNTLLEGASASEDRAEGVTSDTLEFGSASIELKTSRIVGTIPADADAGNYDIEVAVGGASATVSIIVSDVASMISVSCDPEIIATDSGLTDCTATVTDAMGSIPSNLGEAENAMGFAY